MQMYLWGRRLGAYRAVNGGDDASILYHEYTHGLSNRLIRDAAGAGALNSEQAGAMGEGWSDWYAKDFLVAQFPGLDDPARQRRRPHGRLHRRDAELDPLAGARLPGRRGAAVCPGAVTPAPAATRTGHRQGLQRPEVHYDGEIWAETLWDLRTAIGSGNAERLITQGMRLSPAEPSFLDERNAILAADQAAGGTFRDAIWTVFAGAGWATTPRRPARTTRAGRGLLAAAGARGPARDDRGARDRRRRACRWPARG